MKLFDRIRRWLNRPGQIRSGVLILNAPLTDKEWNRLIAHWKMRSSDQKWPKILFLRSSRQEELAKAARAIKERYRDR